MIRRPPRSTQSRSSAASDVYKRQDYKEECQRKMTEYFENAKLKVVEQQGNMTRWEVLCVETEEKLRQIDACIYHRDYWESAAKEFWVSDDGRMVDSGWDARVERRR